MTRLRYQIFTLVLIVASASALITVLTATVSSATYIQEQINDDMENAVNLFKQVLQARSDQLFATSSILTSDFGFKQAVATRDVNTIESALSNHGERIDADLMLLLDLEGQLLTADRPLPVQAWTGMAAERVQSTLDSGGQTQFLVLNGDLYQLILIPIRAPVPIALAGIGFRFDEQLKQQLGQMTGLEISFLQGNQQGETLVSSSLAAADQGSALDAPDALTGIIRLPFTAPQAYVTRRIRIEERGQSHVEMALSAPLAAAFKDYDDLIGRILWVSLASTLLAGLGSLILSGKLVFPLVQLEKTAHQIAGGHYHQIPFIKTSTQELKALFMAFIAMRNDLKEREEKIRYQARHDPLTGLLNRHSLIQDLDDELTRTDQSLLILNANIRGFRATNDTFGPEIGDACLLEIARRLSRQENDAWMTARAGADEFLAVYRLPAGVPASEQAAVIYGMLRQPLFLHELALSFEFSIGWACFPEHGASAAHLIRRAGIAMETARKARSEPRFYQTGEEEKHLDRLNLQHDLKQALATRDGQLRMAYQPKVNLVTGAADKCEALIRWIHPTRKFVPPDEFVALAEQSGLIAELTHFVVDSVIAQAAQWQKSGLFMQIAVNLSAQDVLDESLLPYILETLKSCQLDASYLSFELTERDVMQDTDKAIVAIRRYSDAGFDFAVDDYGIGESSLSKLKQLPVCMLKIDKSFVLRLNEESADQIIVASTVDLARRLDLSVVAEGVENAESLALLSRMGCHYAEGYHLARPMPPEDIPPWVSEQLPQLHVAG